MTKSHETPILTRLLYFFGAATVIGAVVVGTIVCVFGEVGVGFAVISGGVFAGIIYIGIGQAVDYLARTAFSTDKLCTILQTSITERLRAIESRSFTPVAPTTTSTPKVGYFYSTYGSRQGPVDATDLRMMRKDGLVADDTPVLREDETVWRTFKDYLALSR